MLENEMIQEIRDINLRYLLLAQHMLREDRSMAIVRLGISSDSADVLSNLSTAQVMKLAASHSMLTRFRFDDVVILGMLTNDHKAGALSQYHMSILLAGQDAEAIC